LKGNTVCADKTPEPPDNQQDSVQRALMLEWHRSVQLLRHLRHNEQMIQNLYQLSGLPPEGGEGHFGQMRLEHLHALRGQSLLLARLTESDGMQIKNIVDDLGIRPSSASELVSKLEKRGLVHTVCDSTDRRVRKVFLTEQGRVFADQMKAAQSEVKKELFAGLTDADQSQLLSLLKKMNAHLAGKYQKPSDDL